MTSQLATGAMVEDLIVTTTDRYHFVRVVEPARGELPCSSSPSTAPAPGSPWHCARFATPGPSVLAESVPDTGEP